jgi:hypothetical protein
MSSRKSTSLHFSYTILFLSLIFAGVLLLINPLKTSEIRHYQINQTPFILDELPLNPIYQSAYAQSSISAVSNFTTDENEAATSAVKPPSIMITIISLIISLGIVAGIFVFVNYSLKSLNMKFGDIIRDGNGFPSLARFQFLLWTFVALFSVMGVFLIRLFMGIPGIVNEIPENLLILTGISLAVPIVSSPISSMKYGERKPPTGTLTDTDRRRLATMLMENEKITVSRFQMFAWTIISIIVYLGFFFSETIVLLDDVNELEVPDIPQVFVYLMGLSQVGYVGVKGTIPKSLTVTQVIPNKAAANGDVTIIGTNFGSEGKVFFEDGAINVAGNQVPVQSKDIIKWQETRIDIKVPSQGLVVTRDYYIRVEASGLISYKGGGQGDEAKFTMQ